MEPYISAFVNWVLQSYGRTDLLVVLLGMLALLGATFFGLSKLPESKNVIVWSKCATCKYKFTEKNTLILKCPKYEKETLLPLRKPVCSRPIPESDKIEGVGNCTVMERADAANYTE